MPVLSDGYTPAREELARISELRKLAPDAHGNGIEVHKQAGKTELRGSLHDHEPDLTPVRGTHELHEQPQKTETEPHGMYWHRGPDGALVLKPHPWFIKYIAQQAETVFVATRAAYVDTKEFREEFYALSEALQEYIAQRGRLNPTAADRKLKQELDDAAYQLCQAAKFKCDAEERAKFLVERDEDPLDNEQISKLIDRAQEAAHEGLVIAYAVSHAGCGLVMDFNYGAKRVLDYSCRRLTEWFAQRRQNAAQQKQVSIDATKTLINNMFLRRST